MRKCSALASFTFRRKCPAAALGFPASYHHTVTPTCSVSPEKLSARLASKVASTSLKESPSWAKSPEERGRAASGRVAGVSVPGFFKLPLS